MAGLEACCLPTTPTVSQPVFLYLLPPSLPYHDPFLTPSTPPPRRHIFLTYPPRRQLPDTLVRLDVEVVPEAILPTNLCPPAEPYLLPCTPFLASSQPTNPTLIVLSVRVRIQSGGGGRGHVIVRGVVISTRLRADAVRLAGEEGGYRREAGEEARVYMRVSERGGGCGVEKEGDRELIGGRVTQRKKREEGGEAGREMGGEEREEGRELHGGTLHKRLSFS